MSGSGTTLLTGTQDERDTLREALAAVSGFANASSDLGDLGAAQGNVTVAQVAAALAQLENANITADDLSAALGSALDAGLDGLRASMDGVAGGDGAGGGEGGERGVHFPFTSLVTLVDWSHYVSDILV